MSIRKQHIGTRRVYTAYPDSGTYAPREFSTRAEADDYLTVVSVAERILLSPSNLLSPDAALSVAYSLIECFVIYAKKERS
jgi:hypothetical protein